jgi:hypothetical protein
LLKIAIQGVSLFLARAIRQEEEIKEITNGKGKIQTIPICPKHPKNSTKNLIDITHTLSKEAGHKINLQNSVAFLYTNNEHTEIEYRK